MSKYHRNSTQRDKDRARIKASRPNCGICGERIDYLLPWTDPRSFVVDHVVPLSKGGPDVLANKQAAHRRPVTATARSVRDSSHQSFEEASHLTDHIRMRVRK